MASGVPPMTTELAITREIVIQAQRLLMARDGFGLMTLWAEFPDDVQAMAVKDALVRIVGEDMRTRN